MKKLRQALGRYLAELTLLAGCASITVGAGMAYLPAGLIVGGALVALGAILSMLGGDDDP